MRVRHPVGRAGRLWLDHRLEVAVRGQDLLERKRMAMELEWRRLSVIRTRAEAAWRGAYRTLSSWTARALVLAGHEQLRRVDAEPAGLEILLRSSFGVVYPAETRVSAAPARTLAGGGTSALELAARAAPPAVEAGIELAASRMAVERLEAELRATSLRLRAIEHRWVPALTEARRLLDLQLEEREREELVRSAWSRRRGPRSVGR